jgi:hypothetical protein
VSTLDVSIVAQTNLEARFRFKSTQPGMAVPRNPVFSCFGNMHYNAYESVFFGKSALYRMFSGRR